ncbi:hypothetical protein ACRALDRAFT_1059955 [Sodiomyces alcalophilus JCM 7366]|uniref:uncharacterized protein n=1 Tax=Sodiomyces alcalophilus JCM 7366 TaxID=591952 RepID=UPI0039B4030F
MAGPRENPIYPTTFRSNYGPKYHYQPSVAGLNFRQLARVGAKAGAMGGVAFVALVYYASGIPRVQQDVLQKVPVIGGLFVKEPIPESDNPF